MKKTVYRIIMIIAGIFIGLSFPLCLYAGGDEGYIQLADEYFMIAKDEWPSEVTFADTAFAQAEHAPTASILKELNGAATDEHTFTVRAGDRLNFKLTGTDSLPVSPYETLIHWRREHAQYVNLSLRFIGVMVEGDGLYLIQKDTDGYVMDVSDFGFDTDLSDLHASVHMSINLKAHKLYSMSEMPTDQQLASETWIAEFTENSYTEGLKFDDSLHIEVSGSTSVMPMDGYASHSYLENGNEYNVQQSDTVGFQFVFDENADWKLSLNGKEIQPDIIVHSDGLYRYYDSYTISSGQNVMLYDTLTIVLVDSNLVQRQYTVVDKWLEAEKHSNTPSDPSSADNTSSQSKNRNQTILPLASRKFRAVPVLIGLAAVSVAASAVLSASSSLSTAEEEEKNDENTDGSIIINENEDLEPVLGDSRSVYTVPVVLDTAKEGTWNWAAAVLTDEKQKETMPGIVVSMSGNDRNARLAVKAADAGYDYGAVIRVFAVSSDQKIHVNKAVAIQVITPGLCVLRKEDSVTVTLRTEGDIPGSAEIRELTENEYTVSVNEDGIKEYVYQEYRTEEKEAM